MTAEEPEGAPRGWSGRAIGCSEGRIGAESAARLELRKPCFDLALVLVRVQGRELLVQRGGRHLLHAPDLRLLPANPLLEAVQLARRIEDRGALHRLLVLAL